MLIRYRLPMGNLHVLNTINFHQQLRTMVHDSNISFDSNIYQKLMICCLLKSNDNNFLFTARRNCAWKHDCHRVTGFKREDTFEKFILFST